MAAPSVVPIPVLPADSSQLRALSVCAAGANAVVHGPPGTGKSQTISSLIADAIGRGQKVLFVSAKMAALSVVYSRLKDHGLDQFCLEAHSTKAGKAKVIEELRRTLENVPQYGGEGLDESLAELVRVRQQLNAYVRALHERLEPLGRTVFQAIGRTAKLAAAPDVCAALPWADPLQVSRAELGAAIDALEDLATQSRTFDVRATHPWRGFNTANATVSGFESIAADLKAILMRSRRLLEQLAMLATTISPELTTLSFTAVASLRPALDLLRGCQRLPANWASSSRDELASTGELLKQAAKAATLLHNLERDCREFSSSDPAEIAALLEPMGGEFRTWNRILKPRFWKWRAAVREKLRPHSKSNFTSLMAYRATVTEALELRNWLDTQRQLLSNCVDESAMRNSRTLESCAQEFMAAVMLRDSAEECSLHIAPEVTTVEESARMAASEVAGSTDDETLRIAVERLSRAWPDGFVSSHRLEEAPLSDLGARCEELLNAAAEFHEWVALQYALEVCTALNLASFLEGMGNIGAKDAPAAFEKRFYTLWTRSAIDRSPELTRLNGDILMQRASRFRQLDEDLRRHKLAQIKSIGATTAGRIANSRVGQEGVGELALLQRELAKQKRFKPLRKLFAEVPRVLQVLKPCMLMSPLSVSTFLRPGSLTFDLVVFDEASQLPTQEAIPSILRARQVVVAGDAKQLPPSSFFATSTIADSEEDDEDSEALEPLESLLDDCVAVRPVFSEGRLLWHYRSKDERLIKFSNHYFYDNALITFPSATISAEGRGVHLSFVPDGVWDRGRSRTNRREAKRVAELVIEQLSRFPARSLGVAAMNATQREAIEAALDDELAMHPQLAPLLQANPKEPFFIKALENVQGDERDTIILSVGYARTETGSLSLNFGPLNRDGGWRRLNVLVTRAKWQLILVTSIRSQDLAAVLPGNRGAIALRDYIAYAERAGQLPPEAPHAVEAETNEFEEAVAEALRMRGLLVDEQVGASGYRIDLAIRDPRSQHHYLIGVECDGATYHSARTARDRDLLRQQVLREQGWRLHRVWSTDWFRNPEKTLDGVLQSVHRAMGAEPEDGVVAPPPKGNGMVQAPTAAVSRSGPPAAVARYRVSRPYAKFVGTGARENLLVPARQWWLQKQITDVVSFEAPLHVELLVGRLKELNGVARAGVNVETNIKRAVVQAARTGAFRWLPGDMFIYSTRAVDCFRTPADGVFRGLPWIAPEEIALAVLHVVEEQFGHPRESLPRMVGEVFGIERTHADAAELVDAVITGLISEQRLRADGMQVYLP
jgi:very-short-patch-repair endonuclease